MQKGIIGKKLGMTQLFDANGKVVPVTIIEAGPCTVVQKKTVESDGYQAVQMGYGEVSAKKVNKAAKGHFDKADVAPKRTLREFRFDDIAALNVGDILKADVFAEGDKVDVVGTSSFSSFKFFNSSPHRTHLGGVTDVCFIVCFHAFNSGFDNWRQIHLHHFFNKCYYT